MTAAGRPSLRMAALLAAALALAMPPAAADADADPHRIVHCHEPERDLVTRVPARECAGRIVTAGEAARLAEARSRRAGDILRDGGGSPAGPGKVLAGVGSGFFINRDGLVLTNRHVVENCPDLVIALADGRRGTAEPVAVDAEPDLALLRTPLKASAHAVFSAHPARIRGNRVAVVGFPVLGAPRLQPILTPALARPADLGTAENDYVFFGDVRSGHSGSPVLDDEARVVGMVTATVDTVRTFRETGVISDGLGMAASNTAIARFLKDRAATETSRMSLAPLSDAEILRKAAEFVVRIDCYRSPER